MNLDKHSQVVTTPVTIQNGAFNPKNSLLPVSSDPSSHPWPRQPLVYFLSLELILERESHSMQYLESDFFQNTQRIGDLSIVLCGSEDRSFLLPRNHMMRQALFIRSPPAGVHLGCLCFLGNYKQSHCAATFAERFSQKCVSFLQSKYPGVQQQVERYFQAIFQMTVSCCTPSSNT